MSLARMFRGEEGKTADEIKAEIDVHIKEKERIEATLPQSITISAFHVNTDSVRLALAKKHKDITKALLDLLVEQLRKETEEVHVLVIHYCSSLLLRHPID